VCWSIDYTIDLKRSIRFRRKAKKNLAIWRLTGPTGLCIQNARYREMYRENIRVPFANCDDIFQLIAIIIKSDYGRRNQKQFGPFYIGLAHLDTIDARILTWNCQFAWHKFELFLFRSKLDYENI
jgi:hypothetical protein